MKRKRLYGMAPGKSAIQFASIRAAIAALMTLLLSAPLLAQDYKLISRSSGAYLGAECYQLTAEVDYDTAALWNTTPIDLNNAFDMSFSAYFGRINNDPRGADGIVFVLQKDPNGLNAIGGIGESMGYGFPAIAPSFAVEFDTYYNGSKDPVTTDHIDVLSNGDFNTSLIPGGGVDVGELEDDNCHVVRFVWDPSTQNFQVHLDGTMRVNITVDIISDIFNGNGQDVTFGFTSATAIEHNYHKVAPLITSLSDDIEICSTDGAPFGSFPLMVEGSGNFTWIEGPGMSGTLSCTDCANPTASPTSTGYYIVQATPGCIDCQLTPCSAQDTVWVTDNCCPCCKDVCDDLVINGGFENNNPPAGTAAGNNFVTQYNYRMIGNFNGTGQVAIANNTTATHGYNGGAQSGNFYLVADGSVDIPRIAWQQTVNVTEGANYCFSFWALHLSNNPNISNLQFRINGVAQTMDFLGNSTTTANPRIQLWDQACGQWTADTNVAVIEIFNNSVAWAGNDFALDNISFKQQLTATAAATEDTICLGSSTQLSGAVSCGEGPFTFEWSPATGLSSTNSQTATATPTQTTTYTLTVIDGDSCIAKDSVTIVVTDVSVTFGPTINICEGEIATLCPTITGGSGPYTYSWSTGSTDSCISVSPPPYMSYVYKLVVTDANGCKDSAEAGVTVFPKPVLTFPSASYCEEDVMRILPAATPPGGTYSGTGVIGNTLDISTPGSYPVTYTYTDLYGCTASITTTFTVHPEPIVSLAPETYCAEPMMRILPAGSPAGGTYSGPGVIGNTLDISTPGVYPVTYTYTNFHGCTGSVTTNFIVEDCNPGPCGCCGNLVTNGDFETDSDSASGPVGFTTGTSYTYTDSAFASSGNSAIVTDASISNPAFTGSNGTNIYVVDGSSTAGDPFWQTCVTAPFGADSLCISFDIINVKNDPNIPSVSFMVNGVPVTLTSSQNPGGGPTVDPNFADGWITVCGMVAVNPTGHMCISLVNSNTSGAGNDFAIDNIQVGTPCEPQQFKTSGGVDPGTDKGADDKYQLEDNIPNPLNDHTLINYYVPYASSLRLEISDSKGNRIKECFDRHHEAGHHSYEFDASGLESGTYYYTLATTSGGIPFRDTKKMIIAR